ncbi:MAG: xylulokinase [Nocardioidaceae bacterium]
MASSSSGDRHRRFVLAVDLGTGGLKVGLVSLAGEIVWSEHRLLRTVHGPGGAATQDADEWWRLVADATRLGVAVGPVRGEQVVAVGVTGQWASTVPVDAAGAPVGDCVMWMDTRGAPYSRAVVGGHLQGYRPRALATWIRHSGGVPSTSGADPLGHVLHLEHDRPDVAAATRWYLEPVDYLSMRFTGVAAASPMSMTAAWLTDNREPDRTEYDEVLVAMAGVPRRKLPPLVRSGSVVGQVTAAVAQALGISAEARVVTGMPDLHSAALGSGCVLEHEAHMAIGTSAWVSCPLSAKKTDVLRQMATVPGPGTGGYLLGNNQESAGRCLQWFRDNVSAAGAGGYEEILALAATAPAGAGGVVFTPWLAGERSPVDDRAARAGFHDLSVGTSYAHLARAVLEGVAYNLRWLLGAAEHVTGRRLEPIRIIGGGAQSDLWCQVVADVCDRTIERVADPLLAGLRGVALSAGMALGEIEPAELRSLVPVDATFRPDARNRAVYDRLFAEFPRLYRAQRRMFARLDRAR